MLNWFSERLVRKLTLSVFVIVTGISFISGLRLVSELENLYLDSLRRDGDSLANTMAAMSVEPMLSYDLEIIRSHTSSVGNNNPYVIAIRVFDDEGKIIASYQGQRKRDYEQQHTFRSDIVVKVEGLKPETRGTVEVVLSEDRVRVLLRETENGLIIGGIAMLAILSFFLYWVVRAHVLKPISVLDKGVLRISKGDLDFETRLNKNDELGRLGNAMDSMRVVLQHSSKQIATQIQSLQNLNRELLGQKEAFSRFVPTDFLEHLGIDSAANIKIGASSEEDMTILFSDIRSFTALCEGMNSHEVLLFLNNYFAGIVNSIVKQSGFVDKFIGDAVMGIFAKKESALPAADRAVLAGLEILEHLKVLNADRKSQGLTSIRIGIGIHTGPLVIGTIGSSHRMDTTVIGDSVNVASRIEEITKYIKASFLISESTYERLENVDRYFTRYVGIAFVRGRQNTIKLYEVFDYLPADQRLKRIETRDELKEGILLFQKQYFLKACKIFNACLEKDPSDELAKIYASRSKEPQLGGNSGSLFSIDRRK